jgi:hypothetical protein
MKWILLFFCVSLFVVPSIGLKGKELYDYMCLFINAYINDPIYQKTIDSIYASSDWKTLDAQYGPFIRPTPAPTPPPPTYSSRK